MTDEPMTPMREEMARWHEVFSSCVAAGFSEEQAIRITIALILKAVNGGVDQ